MAGIVAMSRRQITANDLAERRIGRSRQPTDPAFVPRYASGDFRGETVFRREVAVKATVRQSRPLHDVGDADAVEPVLAKERAGRVQNPAAVCRRLLARDSHGWGSFSRT